MADVTRIRLTSITATTLVVAAASLGLTACGGGGNDTASTASAQGQGPTATAAGVAALGSNDGASSSDTPGWTTIANEGESFTVNGTQTVRYGSGTSWITMSVTNNGQCTNAAFGNDPSYGVVKTCQVADASSTTWTKIADEGATFTISGTQTVRYGAGSSFVTQQVTGNGTCSNAFFGNDPAYGVVKECDVASSGGTTTAPVAGVCTPPLSPSDTSSAVATVGDGTPGSCTEAALRAAVTAYGTVKFNCGAAPATISIGSTIAVPTSRDTVIDGENKITLDGGGTTRILSLMQGNYRTNTKGLTLQHIVLRNAKAPGGGYVPQDPSNPSCAYGYQTGGGAAIQVQDAVLHVFDVDFQNNAAATPGPDIGGGGIYASGSLDVLVSGSRFNGNSGANAGAVGMLNSNLRIYNSVFNGNTANGFPPPDPNANVSMCPGLGGGQGQSGSGGGGGAVDIDGGQDGGVIVCGSTFIGNHANNLGGGLFRVPDGAAQHTAIDRSLFQGNTARQAGAFYIMNSAPLDILASTFTGNSAITFGTGQVEGSQLNIVNSTFSGNEATQGVGGALAMFNSSSSSLIQNTTFADNKSSGGPGYFSAAIFGDSNFAIVNTVFSNNTTSDPYNPMQCGFSSAPGSNDLQWPATRATGGLTDTPCVNGIAFADPLLGALADNGGPTPTRAPAPTSPLRNAGHNCPPTDQRGNPRNAANCTIGAVE